MHHAHGDLGKCTVATLRIRQLLRRHCELMSHGGHIHDNSRASEEKSMIPLVIAVNLRVLTLVRTCRQLFSAKFIDIFCCRVWFIWLLFVFTVAFVYELRFLYDNRFVMNVLSNVLTNNQNLVLIGRGCSPNAPRHLCLFLGHMVSLEMMMFVGKIFLQKSTSYGISGQTVWGKMLLFRSSFFHDFTPTCQNYCILLQDVHI